MNYPKPYSSQVPEQAKPVAPMVYVKEDIVWEYKCITRNLAHGEPPSAAELNHQGKEGWELTATVVHGDMAYFYLKRLL
jgi:hypothetical protein